jgi:hypothetical protein
MMRNSPGDRDLRSAITLAADLERQRLEMGIERAQRALGALHRLADDRRRQAGGAPRQIARAISDFESQIAAARARLADIAVVDDR